MVALVGVPFDFFADNYNLKNGGKISTENFV
jgi:hypothetical protein